MPEADYLGAVFLTNIEPLPTDFRKDTTSCRQHPLFSRLKEAGVSRELQTSHLVTTARPGSL